MNAAQGEHSVALGGRTLHVRIDGAATGPWQILSNSIATDLGVWDEIIPALGRDHRILRYDTRGHGRSAPVDAVTAEATSFADLAADAIGLLDHFAIGKADFIGLSLGGMTAWGAALAAPERFRSLTIIGARADMPEPMVKAWSERIATVRQGGMKAERDATLARWFTADFRRDHPAAVARISAMIEATSPGGFIAGASALRRLDYLPQLGRVSAPTLLLAGASDGAMPDVVAAVTKQIPYAEFDVLKGGGHLLPVDSGAATAARIVRFLAATR
jgi:3-oxoadipate enol-lactonase